MLPNDPKKSPAKHHKLKSFDDLLGLESSEEESLESLPLSQLLPFEKHPFLVKEDEKMAETMASIQEHGVLVPIIVRPKGRRQYEIVSGHRRVTACTLLGLEEIPALVRSLDDDTATVVMVDSNIQRETLLPSERAFAYLMKMDSLKRQGKRSDLEEEQSTSWDSLEALGQQAKISGRQVQRFIRLTFLIPSFLQGVDEKKLPFLVGVELSYLPKEQQGILEDVLASTGRNLSLQQAKELRALEEQGDFSREQVASLLQTPQKSTPKKFTLKEDVCRFFPEGTSPKEMEAKILELLAQWSES